MLDHGFPGERALREFQVFVTDARYAIPTFHIVHAASEARARAVAEQILAESPHHLGIEVFDDGARLFSLGDIGAVDPQP
jgi:hypothetical protein